MRLLIGCAAVFILLSGAARSAMTEAEILRLNVLGDAAATEVYERLRTSETPRELLAAATSFKAISGDDAGKTRESLLAKAATLGPGNSLVRYRYALHCSRPDRPGDSICVAADGAEAFARADPDNALAWILAATAARRRGDDAGARRLLARAAESRRFDNYLGVTVGVVGRAFRATSVYREDPLAAVVAALGSVLATELPAYSVLLQPCLQAIPANDRQVAACRRIADLMTTQGIMIERMIGAGIQGRLAPTTAERERAARLRTELTTLKIRAGAAMQLLQEERRDGRPASVGDRARAMTEWLDDLERLGEIEAMRRSIARAEGVAPARLRELFEEHRKLY
jgi:hypothetical protein